MPNRTANKSRRVCRIVATLTVLAANGAMAATPGALTDTGTFRAAFSASFSGFDICGDAADGRLYRKALAAKVENCPFTKDAKADFRQWSVEAEQREAAKTQLFIAEHDKLPERLDRKKLNCRLEHETPAYQTVIAQLARFSKGEVGFDAVVPDACDMNAPRP